MFTIMRTVSASNVNSDGLLTFDSAFDFMIDCSSFWMNSEPEFLRFLHRQNLGMFLVSRQAEISRMPAYGEEITISTSVFQCKVSYGLRNTIIRDAKGDVCVASYAVGAFVNLQTGKPSRLAGNISLTLDSPYENMDYLPRKIEAPLSTSLRGENSVVKKSQIDQYNHMNSTKYVILALDMLPADFAYNRMRIEYKTQAKLGDTLLTQIYGESANRFWVTISNGGDRLHAVVEFSNIPSKQKDL